MDGSGDPRPIILSFLREDDIGLRPAVFFDRDGVLNEDRGYVHRWEDFAWLPGAREAVLLCCRAGMRVFVVTNQSGIARGFYRVEDAEILHRRMREELAVLGARVDAVACCPHLPGGSVPEFSLACGCRKPAPGMILELLRLFPTVLERSFLLGDGERDMEAARRCGLRSLLVGPHLRPDDAVRMLLDAMSSES